METTKLERLFERIVDLIREESVNVILDEPSYVDDSLRRQAVLLDDDTKMMLHVKLHELTEDEFKEIKG